MSNLFDQQAIIDDILERFDKDMDKTIAGVEAYIREFLMSEAITATTALDFEMVLSRALRDSGYYELVNKYIDDDFDELFATVQAGFTKAGFDVAYNTQDLERIMALKSMQLDRFNTLTVDSGRELARGLYKYVLSDMSMRDMERQLLTDFEGTAVARYSKTIARTSIKDFQESLIDMKAEGLDGVWIYQGVKDGSTRDFCRCVLNARHYFDTSTKSKIQGDKRRTYNCRHRFVMVSEEYAVESGYTENKGGVCGV